MVTGFEIGILIVLVYAVIGVITAKFVRFAAKLMPQTVEAQYVKVTAFLLGMFWPLFYAALVYYSVRALWAKS